MDSITSSLMAEFCRSYDFEMLSEDKQFEHFSAHCVVNSRFKGDFDTEDLVTGGGSDLNIDAIAILVNGCLVHEVEDINDLLETNGYLEVEFVIMQAKTSSNFNSESILALGDNLANEFFTDTQNVPVSEEIQKFLNLKNCIYQNASKLRVNPTCRIYYVTTGNWNGDTHCQGVLDRKKRDIENTNLFSQVFFEAIGARGLQDLFRETKKMISRVVTFEKLVTLPSIDQVTASYLGVLPATEFIKLIVDDDGNIVKSVFVDNVRDFQGENEVNRDIANTIKSGELDQFVLRNNGITIVAKQVRVTSNQYTIDDYQIVNGCQTSHVIFANRDFISESLQIPIKLIHTNNEEVAQNVVKSTNKQTQVSENDLLALTVFQKDLEDFYSGTIGDHQLFYERRAKQYAGQDGIEKGRVTSIGNQLKSFASMFLDHAHQAGRYQGTLFNAVSSQVFRDNHRPEPYYTSAFTAYKFEIMTRRLSRYDRKIRSFKFHLLYAFRFRYEETNFPGAGNRLIAQYCENLNAILWEEAGAQEAFFECKNIVETAVIELGEEYERDTAKLRSVMEKVKEIAIGRNSNKG